MVEIWPYFYFSNDSYVLSFLGSGPDFGTFEGLGCSFFMNEQFLFSSGVSLISLVENSFSLGVNSSELPFEPAESFFMSIDDDPEAVLFFVGIYSIYI